MQQSRSKYVELESISLTELFKLESGAVGLYFPAKDEDGKVRQSLVRLASQAKSLCDYFKKAVLTSDPYGHRVQHRGRYTPARSHAEGDCQSSG